MIIHPEGTELFHADGLTAKMKLVVVFHNFTNSPKNPILLQIHSLLCLTWSWNVFALSVYCLANGIWAKLLLGSLIDGFNGWISGIHYRDCGLCGIFCNLFKCDSSTMNKVKV